MNQLTRDVEMTSLDISEVTGKRHDHVMRDIRLEIEELGEEISRPIFGESTYTNERGRKYPCYSFGKKGAMQLILKYDAVTRYKVIEHIEELEGKQKVMSPIEVMQMAVNKLSTHDKRITNLEDNMRIDSAQERRIRDTANRVVVKHLGGKDSAAYQTISRKVFPQFWREFKSYFEVPRYGDLPKVRFQEALEFVNEWTPSTSLKFDIKAINNQQHLKLVE